MLPDGRKYVGEFKDGKPDGRGTNVLPDGSKYVGEFKDGKGNGQGTQYAVSGAIVRSGIFANGVFVK